MIIKKCNTQYGAPMGRFNTLPDVVQEFHNGTKYYNVKGRIFDRKVPLDSGGYDKGGAYWGFPDNLRVKYSEDLTFIKFYRNEPIT